MEDICNLKKISYDDISFWYSTLLTMLFYSSYSRKLINHLKIFEKNDDIDNPIFPILKAIFYKDDDFLNNFSSEFLDKIIDKYNYSILERKKKKKKDKKYYDDDKKKDKKDDKKKDKKYDKKDDKKKDVTKVMIDGKYKYKIKVGDEEYYITPSDDDKNIVQRITNFFTNPFNILKKDKKSTFFISENSENSIDNKKKDEKKKDDKKGNNFWNISKLLDLLSFRKKKDDENAINQIPQNPIDKKIIEFISKNGYIKSYFIQYFLNNLNLKYLIIDGNTYNKEFYIGYSENINLIMNKNKYKDINFNYDLIDDYIDNIKKKINSNIPEYIIVNIYNDTSILDFINENYSTLANELHIKNFNVKIDGLEKFDKIIIFNDYKYILDSVSFDYKYNDSIVGIHCNNKKFTYNNKFKLSNTNWKHYNNKLKPQITMLIYVLYEPKKINNLICYNSINKNLFLNHWINCFLIMFFKSYHSKNFFIKYQIFDNKTDELSLFFNKILNNNNININTYNNEDIINLFTNININEYIINYIKKYGYPIHNFIPLIFKFYKIDFLMLDFYKKNFYIGINEFFAYYLKSFNENAYSKYTNDLTHQIYSKILNNKFKKDDYIPKYIFINILNDKLNYIDNLSKDKKEKYNFNYYKIKIDGLKNFKDIIIFKGRKYKLDSFSLNNSNNNNTYDKINRINNSIIGIYCNDDKFIYNGIARYSKKIACKLIKYDWNINKKSNFNIDNDTCTINNTLKPNNTSFSFQTGFKILVYVLIDDDNDEKYDNDYIYSSLSPYLKKKSSSIDILNYNEEKRIKEEKIIENQERIEEEKIRIKEEQQRIEDEQKRIEEEQQRIQEEKIRIEEEQRILNIQKRIEKQKTIEEQEKIIENQKRIEEEKLRIKEEQERIEEEKIRIEEEQERIEEEKIRIEEEKLRIQKEKKKEKEVKKEKKDCPEDKIYNPQTNRCVSKTGKIGKELLKLI